MTIKKLIAGTSLSFLPLILLSGCETVPSPEPKPSPIVRLSKTAPSAKEMETPLEGNGHSALPRTNGASHGQTIEGHSVPNLPPIQRGISPAVDEVVTMKTRDLHGPGFPGASPAPTGDMQPTPPTSPATDRSAEEIQAVMAQLRGIEAKLQDLEGRVAAPASAAPGLSDERYRELDEKVAQLQNQAPPAAPGLSDERYRELDEKVAQLQNQGLPAAPAVEARINELESRLDHVEQMPREAAQTLPSPVPVLVDDDTEEIEALRTELRALQEQVAASQDAAEAVRIAGEAPTQHILAPIPDGHVNPAFAGEYRIGAGDILEFISYDDDTISRESVIVRYDGYISLPMIPDQRVGGLTRNDAEAMAHQAYGTIFRTPRLSLTIKEPASKSYTIIGDVSSPGQYPYTQALRLIEAISIAGGLRDRNANSSGGGGLVGITGQMTKAFVIRRVEGRREVLEYDLSSLKTAGEHGSEAPIYFGDIVYVPEGVNLVYVLGETGNRVIELTEGMTLLQLLSLSGGFNASTGRLGNVILMRQEDGENTRIINLNVREMLRKPVEDLTLNPGDIVYVPQKRLVRISEFVQRFTGSISPVLGLYNQYIDARYSKRISEALLENSESDVLRVLNNVANFGTTTQTITDVFGSP